MKHDSHICSPARAARPLPRAARAGPLPAWVPEAARRYLEHVEAGCSMRQIARRCRTHPSTVMRQVRRIESGRDDMLVDEALAALASRLSLPSPPPDQGENPMQIEALPNPTRAKPVVASDSEVEAEAVRILRRLCEKGAFLVVARGLDRAAVMREIPGGTPLRIAVLDRHVAQAFALRDWIECFGRGKVARYRITEAGRAALRRRLAARAGSRDPGFQEQHRYWAERRLPAGVDGRPRRLRYNLAESPVTLLARRKGPDGKPFLGPELVMAAERLREDFEMAQMGPRVTQNWDRFLTGGRDGGFADSSPAEGPMAARNRVADALRDLGPGLGDIALRCCCYLEGMEAAERRMGWSARSGKIVLRIALERLRRHYEERHGTLSPMIG